MLISGQEHSRIVFCPQQDGSLKLGASADVVIPRQGDYGVLSKG